MLTTRVIDEVSSAIAHGATGTDEQTRLQATELLAAVGLAEYAESHPLRLSSRLLIPVLMRSFSHADELSIAMEARGFGALATRTVHESQPFRVPDGAVVALVWAVSIGAAVLVA